MNFKDVYESHGLRVPETPNVLVCAPLVLCLATFLFYRRRMLDGRSVVKMRHVRDCG
jgi:hypothetical protein